jgi:hypothetical protein
MEDNLRARLTRELVQEKEESLARQKAEYEEKIKALKESKKAKRNIFKPKQKIKEPNSPLKQLQEKEKSEREVNEYRRLRFARSRAGKVANFLLRPNTRAFYGNRALPPTKAQRIARIIAFQRQQQARANFLNNNIGWEAHFLMPRVNSEIINSSLEADRMTTPNIDREIFSFRDIHGTIPSRQVSKEALAHSFADLNVNLDIDAEVNAFANILNPYSRRKKGRR